MTPSDTKLGDRLNLFLDRDLHEALAEQAKALRLSKSAVVRMALLAYLRQPR